MFFNLAAAKKLGIASGVGEGKFAPEATISRQDMIVLMHRALSVMNKLPEGNGSRTLESFADAGEVSDYARAAIQHFAKSGLLDGENLNPKDDATRADMALIPYGILTN